MIQSFKSKETQTLWITGRSKRLPSDLIKSALRKLVMLDAADNLKDLETPPNNRLEALQGSKQGQYSIRINDQWRLCFVWAKGRAYEVEIADYH